MKIVAIILCSLSIAFGAVAIEAPDNLSYLWLIKSAAYGCGGIALLLVDPDTVFKGIKDRLLLTFGAK